MENNVIFCHLTRLENIDSIIENGIRANEDGEIFIYEDGFITNQIWEKPRYIGDLIAINQTFSCDENGRYANFIIDPKDIELEKLENDNVAELSSKLQWILKKPVVYPSFYEIRVVGKKEPFKKLKRIKK